MYQVNGFVDYGDDTLGDGWGWLQEINDWGSSANNVPTYNPNSSSGGGSGINWQSIINQGFGIGSQAIGAWGNNPTQQVGAGGMPIGQGYSPASINQTQAQIQAAIAQQNQAALYASQGGLGGAGGPRGANSLDGIFNSLTSTVSANPMIFAAGALGLYLLMREPPRGRR